MSAASVGGKTALRMDRVAGMTNAAPRPITTRATISVGAGQARAPAEEGQKALGLVVGAGVRGRFGYPGEWGGAVEPVLCGPPRRVSDSQTC